MSYTETFVLCSECGRPDTHINKEGRVLILECEACGAHRPVNVQEAAKAPEKDVPSWRATSTTCRSRTSARRATAWPGWENYIIYVPGTAKGARVKAKITKVSGNVAFAILTEIK